MPQTRQMRPRDRPTSRTNRARRAPKPRRNRQPLRPKARALTSAAGGPESPTSNRAPSPEPGRAARPFVLILGRQPGARPRRATLTGNALEALPRSTGSPGTISAPPTCRNKRVLVLDPTMQHDT
eukprot:scaffold82496_cov29-Tisochrysis_lutea.AAC.1